MQLLHLDKLGSFPKSEFVAFLKSFRVLSTFSYVLVDLAICELSLAGGKTFSTLDLALAYQQVPLEEESRQYVMINTMKGLYRYNRLPFGVASAPSIFQRIMDAILQGLTGVCVYLDDILVTGETEDKHL